MVAEVILKVTFSPSTHECHQANVASSCLQCSFVFVKNDRFLEGSVLFLPDPGPLAGFLICMVLLHYALVKRGFIKFP